MSRWLQRRICAKSLRSCLCEGGTTEAEVASKAKQTHNYQKFLEEDCFAIARNDSSDQAFCTNSS